MHAQALTNIKDSNYFLLPQYINVFWEYLNSINYDQVEFHNIYMKWTKESGEDHGGLSRVLASLIVDELIQKFKYIVPTANQEDNSEIERDKFVPDEKAVSPHTLKILTMFGQYLGICIKTYNVVPLPLPSIFWNF